MLLNYQHFKFTTILVTDKNGWGRLKTAKNGNLPVGGIPVNPVYNPVIQGLPNPVQLAHQINPYVNLDTVLQMVCVTLYTYW